MWQWIRCNILNFHTWTCAAHEGQDIPDDLKPQRGDSDTALLHKFYLYARSYCKHCGQMNRYNQA